MNLAEAAGVVQQLRVLLVMRPWHQTVAGHELSQLVFCFALPSSADLGLPEWVETVAAVFAKLPEVWIVMRLWALALRSWCFVMGLASLVDVALHPTKSGIVHIGHQILEELIGAASGSQAQRLVLQLHQKQLGLFFPRWLSCAPPRRLSFAPPLQPVVV
jgi:hypothetical protein